MRITDECGGTIPVEDDAHLDAFENSEIAQRAGWPKELICGDTEKHRLSEQCYRTPGHLGDHICLSGNNSVLHRWKSKKSTIKIKIKPKK